MDTKKAAEIAAQESATKLSNFLIFPTKLLQKILFSQDGYEECIKIALYHAAYKMYMKNTFRISAKEAISILREYQKEQDDFLSYFSDDAVFWLDKWVAEGDEAELIHAAEDIELDPPGEINLFAAIRRVYFLLNLQKSTDRYVNIFLQKGIHNTLNWEKSFAITNTTFIFRCRDFAKKSRKNERERVLFCLMMGISSIIGIRREWAATNQAMIKARMFGFETIAEYNKFLACKTSPKWLKALVTKYTTRRIFDGLLKDIKERGWCKTIEGTKNRCTIISITKEYDEIPGAKNVHL